MATILLIEDEEVVAKYVTMMLGRISVPVPYDVVWSPGITTVSTDREYDLVLLDLKLQNGEGLSLIKQARSICSNCPIVVITAYTEYTIEDVIRAGAESILYKDSLQRDPQSLERVIRSAKVRYEVRGSVTRDWQSKIGKVDELRETINDLVGNSNVNLGASDIH